MSEREQEANSSEDDIISSSSRDQPTDQRSYTQLLRDNREFRLYLSSYLVTKCGEWLTYVAAVRIIEEFAGATPSRLYNSYLVILKLLPNVLLSAVGGALAGSRDRRQSMMTLDMVAACIVLLNLIAWYFRSIAAVYLVTVLQESVAALYEPCRSALLPLLVKGNKEDVKNGTTLSVLSYSLMTAIGASLGGVVVAFLGSRVCFGTFPS